MLTQHATFKNPQQRCVCYSDRRSLAFNTSRSHNQGHEMSDANRIPARIPTICNNGNAYTLARLVVAKPPRTNLESMVCRHQQ